MRRGRNIGTPVFCFLDGPCVDLIQPAWLSALVGCQASSAAVEARGSLSLSVWPRRRRIRSTMPSERNPPLAVHTTVTAHQATDFIRARICTSAHTKKNIRLVYIDRPTDRRPNETPEDWPGLMPPTHRQARAFLVVFFFCGFRLRSSFYVAVCLSAGRQYCRRISFAFVSTVNLLVDFFFLPSLLPDCAGRGQPDDVLSTSTCPALLIFCVCIKQLPAWGR